MVTSDRATSPPAIRRGRKPCPRCKRETHRVHTPLHLRPVKWLFGVLYGHASCRRCRECGWRGVVGG